ncbi:hypothetical protein F5890DRAFT_1512259 [Lentinula detonsa]|uniref:Uncharacterized protein n=1 Tax=Lentinula detonsa TaxID=2804962 RepID=A0AA38Q0F7_9AGAR|nr:hypothetical protein F5890DRAFT_1512259 [Lentinula detonsa]
MVIFIILSFSSCSCCYRMSSHQPILLLRQHPSHLSFSASQHVMPWTSGDPSSTMSRADVLSSQKPVEKQHAVSKGSSGHRHHPTSQAPSSELAIPQLWRCTMPGEVRTLVEEAMDRTRFVVHG